RLVALLRRLHADGCTIVMTVHEAARAAEGATRLVVIGEGGIAVDEPIETSSESATVAAVEHALVGAGASTRGGAPAYLPAEPVEADPALPLLPRPALVTPPARMRAAWLIALKDLRVEMRSRDALTSAALFAVTVLITASFTAIPGSNGQAISTGILWISILFAVLLGVGRSMTRESNDRAMEGLLLSPAPRESIFIGKLVSGLAMMAAIEVFVVPMFLVLATSEATESTLDLPALVAVVLLATLGLVVIATLFSGIAVGSRLGESLLPLIVMPVAIPLMIAAVETTRRALGGDAGGSVDMFQWFALLAGFDAVVGLAAIATFSFVVEDQ
ncbi:MAG TPA: heme exporter protein CcmB, partial [Propionibacteriaceae bacterium]|nr:heme exporter protein CcmB [Propionibacteriaceae bacterium]